MVLFLEQLIGLLFALLIIYSSIRLFTVLQNKETALSMIFIHKKMVTLLFGLLSLTSFVIFLTGIGYAIDVQEFWVDVLLAVSAFGFFVFTYLLQKIMKGDVSS